MILATRKHCDRSMEIVPCVGITRSWVLKCRVCKIWYDVHKDTVDRLVDNKYRRMLEKIK